jgi:glutathione S-transferase
MPIVHHIPVCPFSQRLEILLELKGCRDLVDFRAVDITQPRSPELLALSGGSTALPILELDDGTMLRESLVILRYLDDRFAKTKVAQSDPLRHAIENLLVSHERDFGDAGYRLLMNRDPARREALRLSLIGQYALLDEVLCRYSQVGLQAKAKPHGPWLWEHFGWAETVFTPLFMRFWCLGYYEDFELPDQPQYARVRAWEQACLAHPFAQQVQREEIVKLYFDYALGMGNGALAPGRSRSSFVLEPHWSTRPWPPKDKYETGAKDLELGLC